MWVRRTVGRIDALQLAREAKMLNLVTRFIRDESGAAAVEYGLLVAAIAAIIILTVFYLGGYVEGAFKTTCKAFSSSNAVSNTATTGAC